MAACASSRNTDSPTTGALSAKIQEAAKATPRAIGNNTSRGPTNDTRAISKTAYKRHDYDGRSTMAEVDQAASRPHLIILVVVRCPRWMSIQTTPQLLFTHESKTLTDLLNSNIRTSVYE